MKGLIAGALVALVLAGCGGGVETVVNNQDTAGLAASSTSICDHGISGNPDMSYSSVETVQIRTNGSTDFRNISDSEAIAMDSDNNDRISWDEFDNWMANAGVAEIRYRECPDKAH